MTAPAQTTAIGLGDALRGAELLGFAGQSAGRATAKAAFVGITVSQSQINNFAPTASYVAGAASNASFEPGVTVTDSTYPSGAHETYTVSYSGLLPGDFLSSGTPPGNGGPTCGSGIGYVSSSGVFASNDPSVYNNGSENPTTPATAADVTTFFESFTFENQNVSQQDSNGVVTTTTRLHDVTVTFADTNSVGDTSLPPANQTVTIHVVPAGNALTVPSENTTLVTAAQTYTGKTQVTGALEINAGGAIATSSQVALKASGALFDVSGAGVGGGTVTIQELSGVAGSSIKLGAGMLSLTETTAATYAGAITDGGSANGSGGSLVVNGSAALTLTGADSYTGKTQIYGQLDLAGSAVLNMSKAVTLKSESAVFDISATTGKEAILNLAGVAGSHIYLGANSLKINESTAATFAGVISDGGVAGGTGGSLIVKGAVPLALTGANTFTGGVTLLSGTLELGTTTAAGVGHALTFAGSATLQLDADALGGSGTARTYGTAIAGFDTSDNIDLASLTFATGATAAYIGNTLTVTSGGSQVALTLTGVAAGNAFTASDDGHGHVLVGLVGVA